MPSLPSFPPIPDGSDDTQRIDDESMGGEDSQQEEQTRLLEQILEELRAPRDVQADPIESIQSEDKEPDSDRDDVMKDILSELRDLNQKIDDLPAAIAQLADQGGLGEDI